MSNLRDQLQKAKLLAADKARQLAHEERLHRKAVGREGLERQQQERAAEVRAGIEETRAHSQQAQARLDAERQDTEEHAACVDILRNDVIRPSGRGQRYYFELQGGELPWFELDEATRFQVQSGAYWIARVGPAGSHVYGLLAAALARRVHAAIPGAMAWAPGGLP